MSTFPKLKIDFLRSQINLIFKESHRCYYIPKYGSKERDSLAQMNHKPVDLRSDTVTRPNMGMKRAIKNCQGDEMGQVEELEQKMSTLTGKESALFLLSGTMGNLFSIMSHCKKRGSEIIVGNGAHIVSCEQANIAQFGGIQPCSIPLENDGTFNLELVKSSIRDCDVHYPSTELICVENTNGTLGGKVVPQSWLEELRNLATEHGVPLHLDGARIFNAVVSCGKSLEEVLKPFDSVSICFSKGLGCPVGSIIAGPKKIINRAKRLRENLGALGNSSSLLASACLYALDHNVSRLKYDHENATLLAQGINQVASPVGWVVESQVETNIVLLHLDTSVICPQDFCDRLLVISDDEEHELGDRIAVLASPHTDSIVRFVLHLDVPESLVKSALIKIQYILRQLN